MEKLRFIITGLIISFMLLAKIFFFSSEPFFRGSVIGVVELISICLVFGAGIFFYFKEKKSPMEKISVQKEKRSNKLIIVALSIFIIGILCFSFLLDYQKKSLEWDAVALYDARAVFLNSGMRFSDMVSLTKWDNINDYYYLLYPPFTSINHFFWYKLNIPLPISTLYSFYFILFTSVLFLLTIPRLGLAWSLLFTSICIANPDIFNNSLREYTNLPFNLFLVTGILLLFNYFHDKRKWQLFFGMLLIATSQWIRFLEPVWVGMVFAFGYTLWRDKSINSRWIYLAIFIGICLIEYSSWNFFTKNIAKNPSIFAINPTTIFEPVIGLFTGSMANIISFFTIYWGTTLAVYFISVIVSFRFSKKSIDFVFLRMIILSSIVIYFLGMYLLSFKFDVWRNGLAGSFVRSTSFLLPIATIIILSNIREDLDRFSNPYQRVELIVKKIYNILVGK